MSLPRPTDTPLPLRLVPEGARDPIASWLDLLERLLRLPRRESEAIREELESHLRERTRDLIASGTPADEALHIAVSELGDIADLAARYRTARRSPRRRLVMNMSLLAITGAAVTIGVVALSPPEHALRISVFAPPPPSAAEERAIARTFDADIRDKALIDALQFCAQSVELRLQVAGNAIESSGVALDNPVTVVDHHATLETFFHALADAIATTPDQRIGYRIDDGILRVSTVRALDRQETVLACYDLSSLAGDVPTDAVPELIQKFVEPAGWEENGGDMAKQHLVGARWFVEAPRRYQAQIEWFLSRLAEPSAGGAARQADPMGVDPTAGR